MIFFCLSRLITTQQPQVTPTEPDKKHDVHNPQGYSDCLHACRYYVYADIHMFCNRYVCTCVHACTYNFIHIKAKFCKMKYCYWNFHDLSL